MNLGDLIQRTRQRLDDKKEPFLWSDDDLTAYLNEAVNEAAERARLITDLTTTAVTLIPLVPDVRQYELHPSVIDVVGAAIVSDGSPLPGRRLKRIGDAWPTRFYTGWADFYSVALRGPLAVLTIDRAVQDFLPAAVLHLAVQRRPLVPMVDPADIPELPESTHADLTYWAAYMAFDTRDNDSGDTSKAATNEARFTAKFGQKIDYNVRRKQLRHQATVCIPIPF